MGRNRKTYSESFKKQVAIEAMDGKRTVAEIAASNNLFINLPTKISRVLLFSEEIEIGCNKCFRVRSREITQKCNLKAESFQECK